MARRIHTTIPEDLSDIIRNQNYQRDLLRQRPSPEMRGRSPFDRRAGSSRYADVLGLAQEQQLGSVPDRGEATRRAKFQGSPESPTITAMREQAQAMIGQGVAAPRMPADTRPIVTGTTQFAGPIGPGGRAMGAPAISQGEMGISGRAAPIPARTPQQKVQDWSDVNTAANAEIVPAGAEPTATPKFNLFGGGDHLDSAMLAMGRDSVSKADWNSYRTMTQDASRKLNQALATRASVPATVEEAQQFIDSLGFDDRVGQHIENEMMRYITSANPALAQQLIGEQKAEQANDSSYVQWVKRNATDPEIARATTADILAARTPESDREFESDINADHFDYDPTTGQPMKRPPIKLTPIEEARELEKTVDATIAQSQGQLQKRWRLGKPEAISIEELTKERTEDIDKQIDNAQKGDLRARKAYDDELIPKEELKKQIAIYFNRTKALQDEKDRLAIGTAPGAQAPAEGAAPFMTPEEVAAAPAGTRFTDDKGRVGTAAGPVVTPPGGKGSITMGGRTVTNVPVAAAAPYRSPTEHREDIIQKTPKWDLRPDGTKKGLGFLGIKHDLKDRSIAITEWSTGTTDVTGKEMDIPTLVPTLNDEELKFILNSENRKPGWAQTPIGKRVNIKAVEHAKKRIAEGKSVFAEEGEQKPVTQKAPPGRQEIEREVAEREYSELDFDSFVNRKIKEAGMTVSDWANAAIQGLYGLGDLANQGALLVGKGTIAATQVPRYTIETAQKMTTAAKNKLSITIENMMRAEEVNKRLAKLTKEAGK